MNRITKTESNRLNKLELIIKEGQATFVTVGEALTEIRDYKLYRQNYETFETYCEDVWGWSASRARQLSIASAVSKALPMVTNERAARALAKLPPPKRAGIVQKIVDTGKKVTAAAVAKLAPPKPKATAIIGDGTGIEVPPEILDLWKRCMADGQEYLSTTSCLRGSLKKSQAEKDLMTVELDFTNDLAILNQLYIDLAQAKPYAVCPQCNGVKPKGCSVCSGRGFVSEFYWKNKVPKETKDLTGRK